MGVPPGSSLQLLLKSSLTSQWPCSIHYFVFIFLIPFRISVTDKETQDELVKSFLKLMKGK